MVHEPDEHTITFLNIQLNTMIRAERRPGEGVGCARK
jgi:hypothetical protein